MDWIHFDHELPHSLTISTPAVIPSFPSSNPSEGPSFSTRRLRSHRAARPSPTLPLMPPALRFPEPATLWTA